MARFENSPNLFGAGAGSGTYGNINCDWCGRKYLDRENERGKPLSDNDAISVAHFGDLQICACCFGKVEAAVLARITDIIPWYFRILKAHTKDIRSREQQMAELRDLLQRLTSKKEKEGKN